MTKKYWILSTSLLVIIAIMIGANIVPAVADDEEETEPNRCEQYLGKVADHLGTDVETLSNALINAKLEMVDEMFASGKLTQVQADEIKLRIQENGACPFSQTRVHRPHQPFVGSKILEKALEEGIITQEQADEVTAIFEQIKGYVEENGRPEIGPRDGNMLDRAVEEGIITQEQANTINEVFQQIKDYIKENHQGSVSQGKMLDRAVEQGIITQDQADEVAAIFEQIKAYVEENGRPEIGPRDGEMLDRAVEEGIITQERADTVNEIMGAIKTYMQENGIGAEMKGDGPRGGKFKMGPHSSNFSQQSSGSFNQMQMNGFDA